MKLYPVEVGARGFTGDSTSRLLNDLGLQGSTLHRATEQISEEAAKASFWLWLRRRDKASGAVNI